jgi:hypothetical protein
MTTDNDCAPPDDESLYYYALNFRTAAPQHAHNAWLELEAFVERLMAEELFWATAE